jgi:competence protein ComGF
VIYLPVKHSSERENKTQHLQKEKIKPNISTIFTIQSLRRKKTVNGKIQKEPNVELPDKNFK